MEWAFYILLPALAWFSKARVRLVLLALAIASVVAVVKYATYRVGAANITPTALLWFAFPKFLLIGFGGGILLATYEPVLRNWTWRLGKWANWILLIVYVVYLIWPGPEVFVQPLLLAGFTLVVAGTDLFGFIASFPVRLLGRISFPLYLIHGAVYYTAFRIIMRGSSVVALTYIPLAGLCLISIVVLSALVHAGVERYAAKLSEQVIHSVRLPAVPQEAA
jgi:peptidoglycan/LPS O-acetylase OafA/YrhL